MQNIQFGMPKSQMKTVLPVHISCPNVCSSIQESLAHGSVAILYRQDKGCLAKDCLRIYGGSMMKTEVHTCCISLLRYRSVQYRPAREVNIVNIDACVTTEEERSRNKINTKLK